MGGDPQRRAAGTDAGPGSVRAECRRSASDGDGVSGAVAGWFRRGVDQVPDRAVPLREGTAGMVDVLAGPETQVPSLTPDPADPRLGRPAGRGRRGTGGA